MKIQRGNHRPVIYGIIFSLLCLMSTTSTSATEIDLEPPGEREFILDLADMIDPQHEEDIRKLCDSLLTDKVIPIIVVTVDSMAKYSEKRLGIESFATLLFNQWEIGHETLNNEQWNTGILLLVSKGDRKARIELGAGWERRQDELSQEIMDDHIIFHFKQNQFSDGIVAGVEGLDKMARKLSLPMRPRPAWHYQTGAVVVFLTIFTVVSLIRRGSRGWAWVFWETFFSTIGEILRFLLTILSHLPSSGGSYGDDVGFGGGSFGGGSFGGGSFGGGFSGGGGATGSW